MESPALSLSRSQSSSNFAPGSHRRSHPNLQQMQHLSLAPLTPKYPIDPADYSAYFDPTTSELHTSSSISHITNLPSPGGILTNSPARSRANSRTRLKRKVKSSVSIVLPDGDDTENLQRPSTPHGALTSQGFGHILKATQARSSSRLNQLHADSSWLVQTGLALTESSRENKGQSWISKRDSSTSLASPPYTSPTEERTHPFRSGRTTPNRSRAGSRTRRSRRELAMTPATALAEASSDPDFTPALTPQRSLDTDIQPDWADPSSLAEAAANNVNEYGNASSSSATSAQIAASLSDELADDDDPYGVLDFTDHFEPFDSDDEAEMRRELARHRNGMAWIDGVVDVFLRLEDKFPDGEEEDEDGDGARELEEGRRTGRERGQERRVVQQDVIGDEDVEAPPQGERGVWGDVLWFGRMVARTVRS